MKKRSLRSRWRLGHPYAPTSPQNIETWNKVKRKMAGGKDASLLTLINAARDHKHPNGGESFINYLINNDRIEEV